MKIIWSRSAQTNLQEIGDYIAQDSPTRALAHLNTLVETAEKVLRFPRAGRVVPEADLAELREVICENYRVIYLIQDSQVLILAVLEGHRLLKISDILDAASGKQTEK